MMPIITDSERRCVIHDDRTTLRSQFRVSPVTTVCVAVFSLILVSTLIAGCSPRSATEPIAAKNWTRAASAMEISDVANLSCASATNCIATGFAIRQPTNSSHVYEWNGVGVIRLADGPQIPAEP